MTTDEEIRRGQEAELLMQNPLIVEAFASVESRLIDALRQADLRDRDMEHEIVRSLQIVGKVKGHFRDVIATGKMAVIQKETVSQRFKKVVGLR